VYIFRLNGDISAAINPDVIFDGVIVWRKIGFVVSGTNPLRSNS
jgi:hypothetical protein